MILKVQVTDMAIDPQSRYDQDEQLINDQDRDESERQQARLRQAFWQARFKKQKKTGFIADGFVGLWMSLMMNVNFGGKRLASKEIEKFFTQPLLLDAIRQAGDSAQAFLMEELTDSATTYLMTCRTDSHFTSNVMGFVRMKEIEIANKAARGTAVNILALLIEIGHPSHRDDLIRAFWNAWLQAFSDFPTMLSVKVREMDPKTSSQIMDIVAGL
jgi:hypothetical protein